MSRSKPPVTAFQEFLRLSGLSVTRFAAEHGLVTRLESVYWLCEPGTQAKQPSSVTFEVLDIVSRATGISPGTLIDDAMAVWREIKAARVAENADEATAPLDPKVFEQSDALWRDALDNMRMLKE